LSDIDRRTSLLIISGALVTGTTSAFGQASVKYLSKDIANAVALRQFAIEAPRKKDFDQFAVNFVVTGFNVRKKSVADAAASGAFSASDRAIADLKNSVGSVVSDNPKYVLTEESIDAQIAAINFLASQGVSLVPDIRDVLPIGIPVADPTIEKSRDNDFGVLLDIALQTMGVVDGKTLVDEAMKDKDVQGFLQMAIPSIQAENWQKLAELLEGFFKFLIAKQFFETYAERVGKRVAFRLGLRCVPILGWVYVAAALLFAIKANYHRFSFA
jgi:hypothetical protein